ncbi:hypothetical protein [Burkholderia multivorans]|nr:hypothetical protein [Burkholderia multivorans]MDN7510961.1 hypothetical protein [Burkholderia multivorans]ULR75104.1 hypothetical protein JC1_32 [Burkholderia phage JC1]
MRIFEPSDDWRTRGLDEWIGEVRPLTPEELRQLEEAREDRAD